MHRYYGLRIARHIGTPGIGGKILKISAVLDRTRTQIFTCGSFLGGYTQDSGHSVVMIAGDNNEVGLQVPGQHQGENGKSLECYCLLLIVVLWAKPSAFWGA